MKSAIHPEYFRAYEKLSDRRRGLSEPWMSDFMRKQEPNYRDWPLKWILLCIFVLLGIGTLNRWMSSEGRLKIVDPILPAQNSTNQDVLNELNLVKRILTGLVPAVTELTTGRRLEPQPASVTENQSGIVRIITEKANLRSAPTKDAAVILALAKGTELLASRKVGQWFGVSSPSGEEAWISESVVQNLDR